MTLSICVCWLQLQYIAFSKLDLSPLQQNIHAKSFTPDYILKVCLYNIHMTLYNVLFLAFGENVLFSELWKDKNRYPKSLYL